MREKEYLTARLRLSLFTTTQATHTYVSCFTGIIKKGWFVFQSRVVLKCITYSRWRCFLCLTLPSNEDPNHLLMLSPKPDAIDKSSDFINRRTKKALLFFLYQLVILCKSCDVSESKLTILNTKVTKYHQIKRTNWGSRKRETSVFSDVK